MKKIIASIIIGVVLFYMSARGINFSSLREVIGNLSYDFLVIVFVLQIILPFLRAFRLKQLYDPLHPIEFMKVFSINSVGYLFIMLIPMRLGEFIIPYLIKKHTPISLSAAMSAIFIERVIDLFVLLSILFIILSNYLLPEWLMKSAFSSLIILFILLAGFGLLYFKSDFVFSTIIRALFFLPKSLLERLKKMMVEFRRGLHAISSIKQVLKLLILSLIIWLVSALVVFFMFKAVHIPLDYNQALIVMSINTIGVSLPSGPGLIGNFQYSCMVALELFNTDKNLAFAFANIYYLIGMGLVLIIGLILLPSLHLSYKEIKEDILKALDL